MGSERVANGLYRGRVVWWKHTYGFIRPEDGSPDVYCHFSAIQTGTHPRNLFPDQIVEFELARGPKGPFASRVKVVVP